MRGGTLDPSHYRWQWPQWPHNDMHVVGQDDPRKPLVQAIFAFALFQGVGHNQCDAWIPQARAGRPPRCPTYGRPAQRPCLHPAPTSPVRAGRQENRRASTSETKWLQADSSGEGVSCGSTSRSQAKGLLPTRKVSNPTDCSHQNVQTPEAAKQLGSQPATSAPLPGVQYSSRPFMKLLTFRYAGQNNPVDHAGVVVEGGIAPILEINSRFDKHYPNNLLELIRAGAKDIPTQGIPPIPFDQVEPRLPYAFPPKIWCIGSNYP